MNRKLRGGFAYDEGMTVVEVVIASVILFFVLTAVLGLVATTTNMGLSARQRAAANNALSSHIERMRSLDFEDIAFPPDGTVPPLATLNVDGFTITIETQITDGAGQTREVEMIATTTGDGFSPQTISRSVVIRNSDGIIAMLEAGEGPLVTYVSPTPAEDSIIFSNKVWADGATAPLKIAVEAECENEEDVITEVTMICQSLALYDNVGSLADFAYWSPGTNTFKDDFAWHTEYVYEGDQRIKEGFGTVRTTVTDSTGAQGLAERRFYIDNLAPGNPGAPTVDVKDATQTRVGWEKATEVDSASPNWVYAPAYLAKCWQVSASGSLMYLMPDAEGLKLETNAWAHTTTPFSRYEFSIASASYRFMIDRPFVPIAEPYVSRPLLAGTATTVESGSGNNTRALTTVELEVSEPTFPVSSIQYDLYRTPPPPNEDGPLTLWKSDIEPTYTESDDKKIGKFGTPSPYYYAYKITYTPSIYKPGQESVIWSDVVGPVPDGEGTWQLVQTW